MRDEATESRRLKRRALATVLLSFLFFVFFACSKHAPALARVNPFADDPFDAVGSFGVQLCIVAALLSLAPALRPDTKGGVPIGQTARVLRSAGISLLALAVTLMADVVAMIRFPERWVGSSSGLALVSLAAGLFLLTAAVGSTVFGSARAWGLLSGHRTQTKSAAICLVGIVILALYPVSWRRGVMGVILTAVVGMVLELVLVAALAKMIFLRIDSLPDDLLDDLFAYSQWLRFRSALANGLVIWLEKAGRLSWVRASLGWLNPRRHALHPVLLIAIVMGVAVALAEIVGEGLPAGLTKALLVTSIFVSIEGTGVLLAYALFARFLGIVRPR